MDLSFLICKMKEFNYMITMFSSYFEFFTSVTYI